MSRSDRILAGAGGAAVILATAAAWTLLVPVDGQAAKASDDGAALLLGTPSAAASVPSESAEPATIVVDVEGAVAQPGIRELPSGSRIADAIAAAGGYAPDVDLDAAAEAINLAERLTDGAQVRVPRVGDAAVAAGEAELEQAGTTAGGGPAAGGAGTAGGAGAVNLNTATAAELEALPGIGPVTVEKIIAARQERPFTSLDDALQRGTINRGQLEDIQGLATAG